MSEVDCGPPTAAGVAEYLREHPGFLGAYPELARSLELPREDGQTTSLASYQLEILRDKNRELNRRMQELFATAEENERLTLRTHQLGLALMRADSAASTVQAMVATLLEDFGGEQVRMVLHRAVDGLPPVEWLQTIPADDPALEPFGSFIDSGEPLCGRLAPEKVALLFGDQAGQVQSAALVAIGRRGLLAIGSSDASRFFPGMGTLFLRLMGETLAAALGRYDSDCT